MATPKITVYASGTVDMDGRTVARIVNVGGRQLLSRIDPARPHSIIPADDAIDVQGILHEIPTLHAAIRGYLNVGS